jgi:hypothetical protein
MDIGPMSTIRKEVLDLISLNERIQSVRAQGLQLTDDEEGLIEMCARELMSVSANQDVFAGPSTGFISPVMVRDEP